jgi:6-phosphogluconolactonase
MAPRDRTAALGRRRFLGVLGAGVLGAGVLAGCGSPGSAPPPAASPRPGPGALPPGPRRLFVGTYTDSDGDGGPAGQGVGYGSWDPAGGALTVAGAVRVDNPSFLALGRSARVLYAVGEQEDGQVSALSLAGAAPSVLGTTSSGGQGPAHLCVSPDERHVLVANYDSGSVTVLPVDAGGGLGRVVATVRHTGAGPDHDRQDGPHPHQVLPTPDGAAFTVVDLGTDSVYTYRLDAASGALAGTGQLRLRPGTGPRHLAWSPDGRFAYLATELAGTVVTLGYAGGRLSVVAEQPALPGVPGNQPAEVAVSPDGRYVYVSNRGPDSVSVFAAGPDGRLAARGSTPCGGRTPRFIALDPTGAHLYSANQDSGTVTTFTVDRGTGALSRGPASLTTPVPTCVLTV